MRGELLQYITITLQEITLQHRLTCPPEGWNCSPPAKRTPAANGLYIYFEPKDNLATLGQTNVRRSPACSVLWTEQGPAPAPPPAAPPRSDALKAAGSGIRPRLADAGADNFAFLVSRRRSCWRIRNPLLRTHLEPPGSRLIALGGDFGRLPTDQHCFCPGVPAETFAGACQTSQETLVAPPHPLPASKQVDGPRVTVQLGYHFLIAVT